MKWYTQQDMPYGKDPIVIKTIDKQIFVGNHQHIHNSSLKHKFKNEEQWVLTTNQNKIEWSKVKEWHYVRKFIEVIERNF
jgi:hypothetical protein